MPTEFAFRARSPLFDGEAITLGMSDDDLRAVGPAGVAVIARVR